jgi:integral membrane sensor domain MASE1
VNREPVITRAAVAAVLAALLGLLGVKLAPEIESALVDALFALAPAVVALVGAWLARKKVTPVSDPRDESGEALVPAWTEDDEL